MAVRADSPAGGRNLIDPLQVERPAQAEEDPEVVAGEAVGLVEKQEAQRPVFPLPAEQVRIPFPFGEHHHHQGGTDANRLAGGESGGIRNFPVGAGATTHLHLQVDVFTVIQQSPAARTPAAGTPEDLVQCILDGQVFLKQQPLHSAFTQRPKHLLHPLHRLNLHPAFSRSSFSSGTTSRSPWDSKSTS